MTAADGNIVSLSVLRAIQQQIANTCVANIMQTRNSRCVLCYVLTFFRMCSRQLLQPGLLYAAVIGGN